MYLAEMARKFTNRYPGNLSPSSLSLCALILAIRLSSHFPIHLTKKAAAKRPITEARTIIAIFAPFRRWNGGCQWTATSLVVLGAIALHE